MRPLLNRWGELGVLGALALALLLGGCGLFQRGGGGGYTLSVPSPLTVEQGGQGQVTVSLRRQGFTGPVTLSLEGGQGLLATSPARDKVAWSFNPNPASGDASTLTLQVGSGVAPGEYALTVRGRAQGVADQTASLTLRVRPLEGGEVALPPPGSGRGFPQPPGTVGPPSGGQGSISRDDARRGGDQPQHPHHGSWGGTLFGGLVGG